MVTHDEEHIKDIYRRSGMKGLVEYEKDLMEEYKRVSENADVFFNGRSHIVLDHIWGLIKTIESFRYDDARLNEK
jgi:hypothetical protein